MGPKTGRAETVGDAELLRRKWITRVAGLTVAATLVTATGLHLYRLRVAMHDDFVAHSVAMTRVVATDLGRTIDRVSLELDDVGQRLLRDTDRAGDALGDAFRDHLRRNRLLREMAVVGPDGRILASSSPRSLGADVSGLDFARATDMGSVFIGLPKEGRDLRPGATREGREFARGGYVTVSRRFATPAGDHLAVAVIGTEALLREARAVIGQDKEAIFLFRHDGELLSAETGRDLPARDNPIFARRLHERLDKDGFEAVDPDGSRWLVRYMVTADHPLVAELRFPLSEVEERWRDELWAPLALLATFLAALLAFERAVERSRRRASLSERETATQRRRLRNILDSAADGIVTIDSKGIVRDLNRSAERIFLTAAEAVGRPFGELLPGSLAAMHQRQVDRYVGGGEARIIGIGRTVSMTRRDGRAMLLHLAISELEDGGERLFTGLVRDVTEERAAEERFRTLFEGSAEAHLLFDAKGVIDCNPAALSLFRGKARADVVGLPMGDLLAPVQPDGKTAAEALAEAEAAAGSGSARLVLDARGLDGATLPVEVSVTEVQVDGRTALLGVWRDLSESRRHEEEMRRARDAAEAAAEAKSRFLAMMSHELRTPLTGVLGMADLLRETALTADQEALLERLRGSARSLLTILNDVLDYSKIEARKLEVERVPFDPAALVAEVASLLDVAASERGDRIEVEVAPGVPRVVLGDPTRVRQVLLNLVGNAVKFTADGLVTVRLRAEEETRGPGTFLAFEVADTGIGIAPEARDRLFQPFVQADTSTTRRFGGTGLGLAISRELTLAMGGAIAVRSAPGAGSTFSFSVRVDAADHASPAPADAPAQDGAPDLPPLDVLLADDNDLIRMMLVTRLSRLGHRVVAVEHGGQALEVLATRRFDLLLLDMQMPVLDGPSTARAVRALDGEAGRIPIVALTADVMPEERMRHVASGIDAYVTKPVDWKSLIDAMAGVVGAASPATGSAAGPTQDPRGDAIRLALAAMGDVLGEDALPSMVETFIRTARHDVGRCRDAVSRGDVEELRRALHNLRGTVGSFGLDDLAARAADVRSHLDDPDLCAQMVTRLEAELEVSVDLLARQAPAPA